MLWRDATACYRDKDPFPGVGAEEGGGDVGVLEVEEGGGEGLEGWGWGCWEVDELDGVRSVSFGDVVGGRKVRRVAYALIRDYGFTVTAFYREGLFARVGFWCLEC